MVKPRYKVTSLLVSVSLLFISLAAGCSPSTGFNKQLREITRPYRFDLITWEFGALVREVGKKDVPGKPVQYGTTKEFLMYFKLSSIADLPKLDEVEAERFRLR